jgi:hypothetical protein
MMIPFEIKYLTNPVCCTRIRRRDPNWVTIFFSLLETDVLQRDIDSIRCSDNGSMVCMKKDDEGVNQRQEHLFESKIMLDWIFGCFHTIHPHSKTTRLSNQKKAT